MGVTGNTALISYTLSLFWGLGCDIFWIFFGLSFCLCWDVGGRSDITALGFCQCRSFITLPFLPLGLLGNNGWTEGCTARNYRCSSYKKHTNQVLIPQAPVTIWLSVIRYRLLQLISKSRSECSAIGPSVILQWKCVTTAGMNLALVDHLFSSYCTVLIVLKSGMLVSTHKPNLVYCYNEAF